MKYKAMIIDRRRLCVKVLEEELDSSSMTEDAIKEYVALQVSLSNAGGTGHLFNLDTGEIWWLEPPRLINDKVVHSLKWRRINAEDEPPLSFLGVLS